MASKQNEIGGWDMMRVHDERPETPGDVTFRMRLRDVAIEALCGLGVALAIVLMFGIDGGM